MAREIDMKELSNLVMEVVTEVEKDLKKVQAKEITPDGYADTIENPIDWESKLGIKPSTTGKAAMLEIRSKEMKAARIIKALRAQRKALQEEMQKEMVMEENKRLRNAIKNIKGSGIVFEEKNF